MGERKEKKKRKKNASSHTKKSKATHLILGQLKPHIRTCLQSNPTFFARESLTAEAAPLKSRAWQKWMGRGRLGWLC